MKRSARWFLGCLLLPPALALLPVRPRAAALSPPGLPPPPPDTYGQLVSRIYGTEDGLPSLAIEAVVATPDGSLWIGTDAGLARWVRERDRFEPFAPTGDIPVHLLVATDGPVPLLLAGRDVMRVGETGRMSRLARLPGGEPICAAWDDARREVLIGTTTGLVVIANDGSVSQPAMLHGMAITALAINPTGNGETPYRYVGVLGRVLQFLGHAFDAPIRIIEASPLEATRAIHDFDAHAAGHHILFFGAADALFKYAERCGGEQGFPLPGATSISSGQSALHELSDCVWIGSDRGVACYGRGEGNAFEYFSGRRWLPSDRVTALLGDERGAWVGTPAGLARIEERPFTLEEKARLLLARLRERHLRHGLVAPLALATPGDVRSGRTHPTDNDGLWTSIALAAECFRFAATGDEDARRGARDAFRAMERLEQVTGLPGFPARTVIRPSEPRTEDGEWHDSADGEWVWKGDTSSDEIVGHFFAYDLYHDFVCQDDPEERERVRALVGRIAARIVDGGLLLRDADGEPTRWGVWDPAHLNDDPAWRDERGLGSLEILSHLRVAADITGDERFERVATELIERHGYAANTLTQKWNVPGDINHSDDELAFLSYYPLLRRERDPERLAIYRESLARSFAIERPERSPLWNAIACALLEEDALADRAQVVADARRTLEEWPLDQIDWTCTSSHRADVRIRETRDRGGHAEGDRVLPAFERRIMRWNGNPYVLDGGSDGREEADGVAFLLPYWMARHHRLVE